MGGNSRVGGVGIALAIAVALALGGCAPTVDGPAEQQRAVDVADGDRLAAQLAALPGAVSAHVTLHRPARDVLGTGPATPATASAAILVIVDDAADRTAVAAAARRLTHATAPEMDDAASAVVVEVGVHRPVVANVGPFVVEVGSRRALLATLAVGLVLMFAMAGWIAWRELRRKP